MMMPMITEQVAQLRGAPGTCALLARGGWKIYHSYMVSVASFSSLDFTIRRCFVHRIVMLHLDLHLYCIYLIAILLYHLHARMLHVRQRRLRILLQVNVCESYAYVLQTFDKTTGRSTGSASKRVLSSISTCAHLLHMARL